MAKRSGERTGVIAAAEMRRSKSRLCMIRLRGEICGGERAALGKIFLRELPCRAEGDDRILLGNKFHGQVTRIIQLAEFAEDVGVIDFTGSGLVSARNVRYMH